MTVMTKDGIVIHELPGTAKCKMAKSSPLAMRKCPMSNFDDDGAICVPEMCEYYRPNATVPCEGKWIVNPLPDAFCVSVVQCSKCGWRTFENHEQYITISEMPFCPMCGTRMED